MTLDRRFTLVFALTLALTLAVVALGSPALPRRSPSSGLHRGTGRGLSYVALRSRLQGSCTERRHAVGPTTMEQSSS